MSQRCDVSHFYQQYTRLPHNLTHWQTVFYHAIIQVSHIGTLRKKASEKFVGSLFLCYFCTAKI